MQHSNVLTDLALFEKAKDVRWQHYFDLDHFTASPTTANYYFQSCQSEVDLD
jgi:hypothetical protein